jgi:hypothetical protein
VEVAVAVAVGVGVSVGVGVGVEAGVGVLFTAVISQPGPKLKAMLFVSEVTSGAFLNVRVIVTVAPADIWRSLVFVSVHGFEVSPIVMVSSYFALRRTF